MKIYYLTVIFLTLSYIGEAQNQPVISPTPADIHKVLSTICKMPFYQIPNSESGVYQYQTTSKDFYYSFTIDGAIPDSISCNDIATLGLIAIQALAEKEKELELNQKLLEETTNRLNEVTHEALKMGESAFILQTKVTDLENKLNDMEFKIKELESLVKRN